MKFAICLVAAIATAPVFVLGFVFECAVEWFEVGRDTAVAWIDEETPT